MVQLNLLPDIKKEYIKTQRTKRTIILIAVLAGGISIAVVALLFTSVYVVQRQHIANLSKDIDANIQTLQEIEDLDKILTIQNQLDALPGLHEQKPQALRIFDYISTVTPPNISLNSMSIGFDEDGGSGTIEISGEGEDFKAVNIYVDSLKNATYEAVDKDEDSDKVSDKAFESVVVESISKNGSSDNNKGASFSITISYTYDIFDYKYEEVKLKVPNITSTVSSQEQPGVNNNPFENNSSGGTNE